MKSNVLASLLDAGLLFLLRFSLDDSVEGVISAAVRGLRALLVSNEDEVRGKLKGFQIEIKAFFFGNEVKSKNTAFFGVLHAFKENILCIERTGKKKNTALCCVGESGQHVSLVARDGSVPIGSPASHGKK